MSSTLIVLVHYKAFGSNQMFNFNCEPDNSVSLSDFCESDLLEFIFRQCNHVDGTEWIANKNLRSMSVGDEVVLIRSDKQPVERRRVAAIGWEHVSNIP